MTWTRKMLSRVRLGNRSLRSTGCRLAATCGALLLWCSSITIVADEPKTPASGQAVRRLVRLCEKTGSKAIAVADPREAGVFVAALYTGSDLFLVRAHHPSTEELGQWIQSGRHQRVFFALRATPKPAGKFFIYDAGADGMQTTRRADEKIDEAREDDMHVVRFGGSAQGRAAGGPESSERAAIDARYARLLELLVSVASGGSAP